MGSLHRRDGRRPADDGGIRTRAGTARNCFLRARLDAGGLPSRRAARSVGAAQYAAMAGPGPVESAASASRRALSNPSVDFCLRRKPQAFFYPMRAAAENPGREGPAAVAKVEDASLYAVSSTDKGGVTTLLANCPCNQGTGPCQAHSFWARSPIVIARETSAAGCWSERQSFSYHN